MRISGAGCSLVDYLYSGISYRSPVFEQYRSKRAGDGGIIPGGLVFTEELEAFAARPFDTILKGLVGDSEPVSVNLGGPAAVAMITTAQILGEEYDYRFYAASGSDKASSFIKEVFSETSIDLSLLSSRDLPTPSTVVLSDPEASEGKGERSFLNTIGAAASIDARDLPDSFYASDIVLLGGTALVPRLHDQVHTILREAKKRGAFTIVGTVFDFRNERRDPAGRWPLGDDSAYQDIDLLVTDAQEALRLSGQESIEEAMDWFVEMGVSSAVITHGAKPFLAYSSGRSFEAMDKRWFKVSRYIDAYLTAHPQERCDTTGCGDNFLGGITASVAMQIAERKPVLERALAWASATGGFSCLHYGGVYHETYRGEKASRLLGIVDDYRKQEGIG